MEKRMWVENLKKQKVCTCGKVHNQTTHILGIQWMNELDQIGLYVWNCECRTTLATPVNEVTERWLTERQNARRTA